MRRRLCAMLYAGLLSSAVAATAAETFAEQAAHLGWVHGPAKVAIADVARIDLPKGPMFLGPADTGKFLVLNGNPSTTNAYTVSSPDMGWFAIFDFDPAGKVADDDKIDADAMLKSFQDNAASDNKERKSAGMAELFIDGWYVKPHYDAASHNLEWGTRLHDAGGHPTVNYTSRILGRSGYMRTTLVSDPQHFDADLAQFRTMMKGYDFNAGQHYSEWRTGDKVAGYGLAALITGGSAAAAVKTGFFKTLLVGLAAAWKFVAVGVVAAFAAVRRFFGRIFNRGGDA